MTKITIETETITTDLTPSEAAAKIKEALGIAEWPQENDWYWYVGDCGTDLKSPWNSDDPIDRYRLSHGNCSPTKEGLAGYKADMAKYAAIVAIRKHRDKTFGVFEPGDDKCRVYGRYFHGIWRATTFDATFSGITVPFFTAADIERSFAECSEHWEVLK